jgi:transposase
LAAKPHPGPKPLLSTAQWGEVQRLLLQGAQQHGWPNALWTADRVAALIKRHFGVDYHPEHVRKVLQERFDWSSHQPQTRPREQNDKEVERWLDDEFPRIVREAFRRQATLVFLDEAGFMLTPLLRRSLWPRGRTQIINAWQRHDRISAISCVALGVHAEQPELYFELLPAGLNVTAEDVVAFLKDLRRELTGALTIVWDRHRIHSRARLVQEWLAKQTDVVLEDLPAYCPKGNPDEMVWGWLKYGRLANLCPQDVAELREHLITELEWAAFDRELLAGFVNHANLGVRLE